MMQKKFYTVKDVATLLMRDEKSVRRYCRSGKLTAKRIGWAYLISDDSLKEFLGPEIYAGVIDTLPPLPADERPEGGKA